MRTGSESQESMRYGDGTCGVEGEQSAPRRSGIDGDDDSSEGAADSPAPIECTQPSEPSSERSSVPKGGGVKAGYEGRARRGNSKEGGYDMTPTRRGPRKQRGSAYGT